MILLFLAAQTAPASAPASVAAPAQQSWSILDPIANEPCVPRRKEKADPSAKSDDIVVCGRPLPSQKVPYAEQIPPDHPIQSNPDGSPRVALAEAGTPCSTHMGGCTVGLDILGMGTSVVRLVQKAVAPSSCCEEPGEGTSAGLLFRDTLRGVKHAFAHKPDKSNRVAIALDDGPPSTAGKILP